jgi:[acyl-carrier-protein] S-malonyltransferase
MSRAFVFPGQGSQSIGMLQKLAETSGLIKSVFDEASSVLEMDLWAIVTAGPEEKLNATDITQPVMLAAGYATWRAWQEAGGANPAIMAGHSLGEYTALVCAGALDFKDAIKLVNARGRYMQAAVPAGTGAMAAILGLDDDTVKQVCAQAAEQEIVQAVNFNSPGQVVIAGHKNAVERAAELAKQQGAKRALILPVSVPSHCQLMRPAADKLAKDLAVITISTPSIPVINNVDVAVANEPDAIRDALTRQLFQPVRWVETIQRMASDGVRMITECGPGKVLLGLNKRIDKSLEHAAIVDTESLQAQLNS